MGIQGIQSILGIHGHTGYIRYTGYTGYTWVYRVYRVYMSMDILLLLYETVGLFGVSVRAEQPGYFRRNENFAFNQNYPARSRKS